MINDHQARSKRSFVFVTAFVDHFPLLDKQDEEELILIEITYLLEGKIDKVEPSLRVGRLPINYVIKKLKSY
jgi:hypothetical protein